MRRPLLAALVALGALGTAGHAPAGAYAPAWSRPVPHLTTWLAFARGDRLLLAGGDAPEVDGLDPATGRLVLRLRGHHGRALGGAVHPDGRLLATGDDAGTVILWDLASGKARRRWGGLPAQVLAWSPDGRRLALGGARYGVAALEVASGRVRRYAPDEVATLGTGVREVRFSPDGRRLVAAGDDEVLRVFGVPDGRLRWTRRGFHPVGFAPGGRWFFAYAFLRPSHPEPAAFELATGRFRAGAPGPHDPMFGPAARTARIVGDPQVRSYDRWEADRFGPTGEPDWAPGASSRDRRRLALFFHGGEERDAVRMYVRR